MLLLYFLFWGIIFTVFNILFSAIFLYTFRRPLKKWPALVHFKTFVASLLTLLAAYDLYILGFDKWALSEAISVSRVESLVVSFSNKILENDKIRGLVSQNTNFGIAPPDTINALSQKGISRLPLRLVLERAKIQLGLIERSNKLEICVSMMKNLSPQPEQLLESLEKLPEDQARRYFEINYAAALAAVSPTETPLAPETGSGSSRQFNKGFPLDAIERQWGFEGGMRLRLMLYVPSQVSNTEKCDLYKKLLATLPLLEKSQALLLAQYLN